MQYTDGLGIVASANEISALTSFCGGNEMTSQVSIQVGGGKLTAWASDGVIAVWHHSETTNGEGLPSQTAHSWTIDGESLRRIRKSMQSSDEVIVRLDKELKIIEAEIRDIKTSESKLHISLKDRSGDQLVLDLPGLIPSRPAATEKAAENFALSWPVISKLGPVTKACEATAVRIFAGPSPLSPVYCEVDEASRLYDELSPRWVVVLMPLKLDRHNDEVPDGPKGSYVEEPPANDFELEAPSKGDPPKSKRSKKDLN